jgi:AraC-like DNA-binding protein
MPETKSIELLKEISDILPVSRDCYNAWTIKILKRSGITCKNYISPNRREFYKILFVPAGFGEFTIGLKVYHLNEPTILFIHPNEIISWRRKSDESGGYVCFFKKRLADDHPGLKAVIDKYSLFSDSEKSVIKLSESNVTEIDGLFEKMFDSNIINNNTLDEDAVQAYLQLLMIASVKIASYAQPDSVTEEFKHIHEFFQLLEKETKDINYTNPVRIRTAKEFADQLSVHPNYLNALLKQHTGKNVSTHIKDRLLEASKILLTQTDWTLQDIGYAIGFADQPNFSQFFKKNIGQTPAEYRKAN